MIKKSFLLFLSNLLKDHAYVTMSYMTGILPISKYSSGSELNMFMEFKMTSMEIFGEYFGFTDEEVDNLYKKYLHLCKDPQVSRESLREWYDGYFTVSGKRLYNPRSVVMALRFNQISNYWTSSGPYDEIFYYIQISDQMLEATLSGDTQKMADILQYAHNTEAPSLSIQQRNRAFCHCQSGVSVSNEISTESNVKDKAGKGYVDFIFYPWNVSEPCIILELKVDSSPEEAIQQIRDKDYILRFRGKLGKKQKLYRKDPGCWDQL